MIAAGKMLRFDLTNFVLVAVFCSWFQSAASAEYSTPPGITLARVEYELVGFGSAPPRHLWTRLGDANGATLFISDADVVPGQSHCTGDCAEEFPPVLALPDARPMGDWTLVERENGNKQWAYKQKPLYRFARETRLNEVVDAVVAESQRDNLVEQSFIEDRPAELPLLPPNGWHIARFQLDLEKPIDINIKDIPAISITGLVNKNDMTIYAYAGNGSVPLEQSGDCQRQWQPVAAAALSNAIGEFVPVTHESGDRQWSYQGDLLFTCGSDFEPGEVNGTGLVQDKRQNGEGWYVPALAHHFVPNSVGIHKDRVLGKIFTSNEMPLYSRYPYERKYGAPRGVHGYSYRKGKEVGTKGCDAKCLQTWRPFEAPADARAQGFWEIFTREDGTRQWAYRGFAQYININNKPGQPAVDNFTIDMVIGDEGRYKISDAVVSNRKVPPGFLPAGFVWHVREP